MAWWKVKVLSRPWAVGSNLLLIRRLKWGTLHFWTPGGSKRVWRKAKVLTSGLLFQTSRFGGWLFLNQWEFRGIMYLIWKVYSVIWRQQLKGVTALLPCATPFWVEPFYTIQRQEGGYFLYHCKCYFFEDFQKTPQLDILYFYNSSNWYSRSNLSSCHSSNLMRKT